MAQSASLVAAMAAGEAPAGSDLKDLDFDVGKFLFPSFSLFF